MRRIFDLVCTALGLVLLAPVMLFIALLVRAGDGGPVLYVARRMGRGGRVFPLYKFRTMIPDAGRAGPPLTQARDDRITRVGRVLRRWKLDELPQLINVLRGDMALVGPRPEDPRYLEFYPASCRAVLSVRPGITSPASITYAEESKLLDGEGWEAAYTDRILPAKLALEMSYLQKRTFLTDLEVIARTLSRILARSD